MVKRRLLFSMLLMCLMLIQVHAADVFVIKGTVVDTSNEPLPGVTVSVVNGTKKALTNVDGEFSLQVSKKPTQLRFTYVGMEDLITKWSGEKNFKVTLKESAYSLENVVVTGYQQIDKRKLSSAITSMNMKELATPSTNSIDQMLQGRVAGVSVMNSSATVGVAPKIRIRGSSSITGNREPVWVVDGIVLDEPVNVTTEELNNIDNVNFIGNAISGLNPDDIERIDILKDVSATAIYGVKAANGVIVVTTKRGRGERPTISYKTNFGLTLAPSYSILNLMNSKERVEMSEEMVARGLEFSTFRPTNIGYEGELQKLWNKEIDYDTFRNNVKALKELNTDWMDMLFRNAFSQQHSVSVSGSGKKMDYYVSLSYLNQQGTNSYEKMNRLTGLAKFNIQLTHNLDATVNFNASSNNSDYPHNSVSLLDYAYRTSRAIPAYNANGDYLYYNQEKTNYASLPFNIFNELETTGQNIKKHTTSLTAQLVYRPWEWLKLSSLAGISHNSSDQENWADEHSFYISRFRLVPFGTIIRGNETYYDDAIIPLGGELKYTNTSSTRYTFRNEAAFNKTFNKVHQLYALVGNEIISVKNNSHSGRYLGYMPFRGKTFADIDVTTYKGYAKALQNNPMTIIDNTNNVVSMYGVATYTYDNRYIANFNIRADGSNRFGQDKSVRFLPVWSASARWNMHNEKFLKNQNLLNEFAVRASYGVQGNVHPSQTPYLIVRQENYNGTLGEYVSTLKQLPNDHLHWEKTVSYNLGLDFSFFDYRVSGTLDIYRKKGYDQIVLRNIAPSNGASAVAMNEGDIENKGWELALNVIPVRTKNVTWSLSFNTGKNYNKITNEGDVEPTWQDYINGTLVKNGYAVNSLFSYRFKGLDPKTGLPTFYGESEVDTDGKRTINSLQEAYDAAFVYSGKREADLTGGFSSSIRYKSFTLNALFSFGFGNKIRLNDLYASNGQGLPFPQQNMSKEFVDRWQQAGDEAKTNIPVLSDNPMRFAPYERKYSIADNRWDMYNKSDIRVASGSFLRCRSISLRYEIPTNILSRIHVRSGNITFETSNLFVIKDSKLKGRDPEQLSLTSGTIPPRTGYSCQLSLTF